MIKPEFFEDLKIAKLPPLARLLFIGLWTLADDYGYVRFDETFVKNRLFPYDGLDSELTAARKALVRQRFLKPYEVKGEKYAQIVNFMRHQKINRPSSWRNPVPLPEDSVSAHNGLMDEIKTKTEVQTQDEIKAFDASPSIPKATAQKIRSLREEILVPRREVDSGHQPSEASA